jgi:hypothetical protein
MNAIKNSRIITAIGYGAAQDTSAMQDPVFPEKNYLDLEPAK